MKTAAIVALACLNVVLVGALLFGAAVPEAQAQTFTTTDYLVVTANLVGTNTDAIYVVDLAQAGLVVLSYDRTNNRIVPLGVRNLRNDFRRLEMPQ